MQKTVLKYVSGLSETATPFEKKRYRKYSGNLPVVNRSIQFDIRHGVTIDEVNTFLDKIRNNSSFSDVRKNAGSGERLDNLQIESRDRQQYTF